MEGSVRLHLYFDNTPLISETVTSSRDVVRLLTAPVDCVTTCDCDVTSALSYSQVMRGLGFPVTLQIKETFPVAGDRALSVTSTVGAATYR